MTPDFTLAIHGGAGTPPPEAFDPARAPGYHAGLRRALVAGRDILAAGGSAIDAVTAAVIELENDPLFNAGHGAVYTAAGTHEMDAAIMDGRGRRAGAVAGICGPKNPILAARGDGEFAARDAGRGRGDGVLPNPGPHLRAARIFPH